MKSALCIHSYGGQTVLCHFTERILVSAGLGVGGGPGTSLLKIWRDYCTEKRDPICKRSSQRKKSSTLQGSLFLCFIRLFCVLSDCSLGSMSPPATEQWFSNFWAPKRTPRCLIIDSLTPWPEILIHKSQRICIFCQYSRCWFGQRVLEAHTVRNSITKIWNRVRNHLDLFIAMELIFILSLMQIPWWLSDLRIQRYPYCGSDHALVWVQSLDQEILHATGAPKKWE